MFVSRNENQMERSVIHRMIKRACKRAGIDERTSSHWLRHSHASVTTTERYLHISPDAGNSHAAFLGERCGDVCSLTRPFTIGLPA